LSKNVGSSYFGGKESVKENRQGCLSRSIKQDFQTDFKFENPHERVKKSFLTRSTPHCEFSQRGVLIIVMRNS
ncbi:MAG: hypothetical protein IJG45_08680, partial [Oscillospiraceae bacterium]|nr:hypothetical protein [Oscillospiraceae bacterium]